MTLHFLNTFIFKFDTFYDIFEIPYEANEEKEQIDYLVYLIKMCLKLVLIS